MKKKILVEGIIGIYRQRHFDRIEIRLGKTDYNLESIVLQALEGEEKNDIRLVFEIERIGKLYDDYKSVKLDIWRTFTSTTMKEMISIPV